MPATRKFGNGTRCNPRVYGFGSNLALSLLPVMWLQGRQVRRKVPRLPEAAGPLRGQIGTTADPLRVLTIGDSTAAGVGARTHEFGLAGCFSRELHRVSGRSVVWAVAGTSGAVISGLHGDLLPRARLAGTDVVLVAAGINNVLRWTSGRRWQQGLGRFELAVRERYGPVPIIFSGLPPIGQFPALPQPLRWILALRASYIDTLLRTWCTHGAQRYYLPMEFPSNPSLFASDGFHPSELSYSAWGRAATQLTGLVPGLLADSQPRSELKEGRVVRDNIGASGGRPKDHCEAVDIRKRAETS